MQLRILVGWFAGRSRIAAIIRLFLSYLFNFRVYKNTRMKTTLFQSHGDLLGSYAESFIQVSQSEKSTVVILLINPNYVQ